MIHVVDHRAVFVLGAEHDVVSTPAASVKYSPLMPANPFTARGNGRTAAKARPGSTQATFAASCNRLETPRFDAFSPSGTPRALAVTMSRWPD